MIKQGFLKCLENPKYKKFRLKELRLVTIKDDSTIGAALLASRLFDSNSEFSQNLDFSNLVNILDHLVFTNKNFFCEKSRDNLQDKFTCDKINNSLIKEA